jgi:hypothetical protein
LDFEPPLRDCVDPTLIRSPTGKDERVHAARVDNREFNVAIKRRA